MEKKATRQRRGKQALKSDINLERNIWDNIAIRISDFFGSLSFLVLCLLFLAVYFVLNSRLIPGIKPFDPAPYNALDTTLSVFAVVLSISVLISQNRQRKMEKIREQVEFEVNVRAEGEITKMLEMLHDIQHKLGINKKDDELDRMKETLDLEKLHEEIKNTNNEG